MEASQTPFGFHGKREGGRHSASGAVFFSKKSHQDGYRVRRRGGGQNESFSRNLLCSFHLEGYCKFGGACKYFHEATNRTGGGTPHHYQLASQSASSSTHRHHQASASSFPAPGRCGTHYYYYYRSMPSNEVPDSAGDADVPSASSARTSSTCPPAAHHSASASPASRPNNHRLRSDSACSPKIISSSSSSTPLSSSADKPSSVGDNSEEAVHVKSALACRSLSPPERFLPAVSRETICETPPSAAMSASAARSVAGTRETAASPLFPSGVAASPTSTVPGTGAGSTTTSLETFSTPPATPTAPSRYGDSPSADFLPPAHLDSPPSNAASCFTELCATPTQQPLPEASSSYLSTFFPQNPPPILPSNKTTNSPSLLPDACVPPTFFPPTRALECPRQDSTCRLPTTPSLSPAITDASPQTTSASAIVREATPSPLAVYPSSPTPVDLYAWHISESTPEQLERDTNDWVSIQLGRMVKLSGDLKKWGCWSYHDLLSVWRTLPWIVKYLAVHEPERYED